MTSLAPVRVMTRSKSKALPGVRVRTLFRWSVAIIVFYICNPRLPPVRQWDNQLALPSLGTVSENSSPLLQFLNHDTLLIVLLLAGLGTAVLRGRVVDTRRRLPRAFAASVALLVAGGGLSITGSAFPSVSAAEYIGWCSMLALAWLVWESHPTLSDVRLWTNAALLGVASVFAYGLYIFYQSFGIPHSLNALINAHFEYTGTFARFAGYEHFTYGNPQRNDEAIFLILPIALFLLLAPETKRLARLWYAGVSTLLLLNMLVNFERWALITLALAFAVMLTYYWRVKLKRQLVLLGAAVSGFVAYAIVVVAFEPQVLQYFTGVTDPNQPDNFTDRFTSWSTAVNDIVTQPTGVGLGMLPIRSEFVFHAAHYVLFGIGVEAGILAMAGIAIWIVAHLYWLGRAIIQPIPPQIRTLSVGLLMGPLCYVLFAQTVDAVTYDNGVGIWMALWFVFPLFALALMRTSSQERQQTSGPTSTTVSRTRRFSQGIGPPGSPVLAPASGVPQGQPLSLSVATEDRTDAGPRASLLLEVPDTEVTPIAPPDREQVTDRRETNLFDFLRLFAAFTVVVGHMVSHLHVSFLWVSNPATSIWFDDGVPLFFILSGFLVYRSCARCVDRALPIRNYFINRFLRIAPALYLYTIVITLFLLFAGAVPIAEVHHVRFLEWFFSNFVLTPINHAGLFPRFGDTTPNGSLWTISVEVTFYLVVPILYLFQKRAGRNALLTLVVLLALGGMALGSRLANMPHSHVAYWFALTFLPYMTFFGIGVIWSQLWTKTPKSGLIALACAIFYVAIRIVDVLQIHWWRQDLYGQSHSRPIYFILWAIALSYSVIWLAHFGPRVLGDLPRRIGDLSYGVYIWHLVVIETVAYFGWKAGLSGIVFGTQIVVIAGSFALALISWHVVEKPALRLKPFSSRSDPPLTRSVSLAALRRSPTLTPVGRSSSD